MQIYPAIDLQNNQCVRLYQGDFGQATIYASHPVEMAQQFVNEGARWLHVIDLDGAKLGSPQHLAIVKQIKSACPQALIQLGGGIRTAEAISEALASGVDRVIIGSQAITHPNEVNDWFKKWGPEKIMLALDVRCEDITNPQLVSHGWQKTSKQYLWPVLTQYLTQGLVHCLCTDIAQDGTLTGPNFSLYATLHQRYPSLQLQAAGGIAHLEDLVGLNKIGVTAAVAGKALYEKQFSLRQALELVW